MKKIGIIPARFGSTRLPGKPLLEIKGKTMIQRVYEQALKADLDELVVATDDERILESIETFGGKAVMTAPDHPSGTDRILEAASKLELHEDDLIINIQGDEPFLPPEMLIEVSAPFENPYVGLATLAKRIRDTETLFDENRPKVLISKSGFAAYFSRSPLPFQRDTPKEKWLEAGVYFKHIGLYAYRYKVLKSIGKLPTSTWENLEKLEQLRWIENGLAIKVIETRFESMGIDTPADLKKANRS